MHIKVDIRQEVIKATSDHHTKCSSRSKAIHGYQLQVILNFFVTAQLTRQQQMS